MMFPAPLTGVTLKAVALQMVAVLLVIVAFGSTVTVIVKLAPVHAPDLGVTV
jgi:type IV secretory pathway VirB3-like protein